MSKEGLPDFEDLYQLAEDLGYLKTQIMLTKAELDKTLAEITAIVSEEPHYFINEKPPSMAFITSNYHVLGYDEDSEKQLDQLRTRLAELEGTYKAKDLTFVLMRDKIDVWRTESANQRSSLLE